jgi:hypothetical protein
VQSATKSRQFTWWARLTALAGLALAASMAPAQYFPGSCPSTRTTACRQKMVAPTDNQRLVGQYKVVGSPMAVAPKKSPLRSLVRKAPRQLAWKVFMSRLVVVAAVMFFPPDLGDVGGSGSGSGGQSSGGGSGGQTSGGGTGGQTGGGTGGQTGGGTGGQVGGSSQGSGSGGGTGSPPPTSAPEPANLVAGILGIALVGLAAWRRSRKTRAN